MSELRWTTTPPTVPGWYWARHWCGGTLEVTRVKFEHGELRAWDAYSFVALKWFSLWSDGPITFPKFCLFDTSAPPVV